MKRPGPGCWQGQRCRSGPTGHSSCSALPETPASSDFECGMLNTQLTGSTWLPRCISSVSSLGTQMASKRQEGVGTWGTFKGSLFGRKSQAWNHGMEKPAFRVAWGRVTQVSSLASWQVTLGKPHPFSEPQPPQLYNGHHLAPRVSRSLRMAQLVSSGMAGTGKVSCLLPPPVTHLRCGASSL